MHFVARQPRPDGQREAVILAALGNIGEQCGEGEGADAFQLHAQMRQMRMFGHADRQHGVVQIDALTECDIDQRQLGTLAERNRMARMKRTMAGVAIRGEAGEHQRSSIHPVGDHDFRTVFTQHGVQIDQLFASQHRLPRRTTHADSDALGRGGEIGAIAAIDKDQTRGIDFRQTCQQARAVLNRGERFKKGDFGDRPQMGEAPGLLTRSGQAAGAQPGGGCVTGVVAAGQTGAQTGIPGQKRLRRGVKRRGLQRRTHAASATMPA